MINQLFCFSHSVTANITKGHGRFIGNFPVLQTGMHLYLKKKNSAVSSSTEANKVKVFNKRSLKSSCQLKN